MPAVPKHSFQASPDPAVRARTWCEDLSPLFEVRLDPADSLPAGISLTNYNFGQVLLGHVSAPAQRLQRSAPMIARQGVDHVLLQFYGTGEGRVAAGGAASTVAAGQVVVIDLSQPVVIEAGRVTATSIVIPRRLLGAHITTIEDLHGQALDCVSHPALHVVQTYLSGLIDCADAVRSAQALHLAQAAVELCGAGFDPGDGLARATGHGLHVTIRQFIEAELGGAAFGVDTILGHFGLSRTSLYRMFESDGGAAHYIRERRLLRALRLLTRPGARLRISAVAYAAGFADEKTFSRAFRRRFGFAPREAGPADTFPQGANPDEPILLSWMKSLTA
jgi:AraC-like DNA-binding protein